MVVRSMASGCVIIFLMILVQNPEELLVLRIIQGALTGSVAASQALVAAAVPRERLGFAMGLMQTAMFTGNSVGPLIGGQLVVHIGYRDTFLAAAAMLLLATMMVWLLVDEQFVHVQPRAGKETRGLLADARIIFGDQQLALLILVLCVVQFGGQIVGPVLPVFVQQLGSNSSDAAAQAGNVFAAAGLGSAVTAVLAGRWLDRFGHHRTVLLVATALSALLTIPQAHVSSVNQLYVLRGLIGMTLGVMLATSSAMLTMWTPPHRRGSVIGLSAGVNAGGQAIGQVSGSALASTLGIRSVFYFTAGVLALVSLTVGALLKESAAPPGEGE